MTWAPTEFVPAANYRTTRRTACEPLFGAIHTAECLLPGTARNVAGWIRSGGGPDQVSAHAVIDDVSTIQCVDFSHVAYTQGAPMNDWTRCSIEMTGHKGAYNERDAQGNVVRVHPPMTPADWQTPQARAQRTRTAELIVHIYQTYGVPIRRVEPAELADISTCAGGWLRHQDFSTAWRLYGQLGASDHSDPGDAYPFDELLAEVASGKSGCA